MLKFVKDKTSFISGICLISLSLLLFYEASSLSPFGSVFPYAITTALLILSVILIFRSFKLEIKVINEKVSFIKIPLLILTFFAWIYFLERAGFILTSLISFNLLILINAGQSIPLKKIIIYMLFGSIFILLLYFGFKNLLLVPLPEGLWFRT
ncbi:tripartite tricarboxylate transporter TctB family protein [Pelagibacteraceae bacterium]|nr:tripartite tricarboxylate transporter TctB family protein [Pelagibacteraceae bacterium]